jgi:hypothetical protein
MATKMTNGIKNYQKRYNCHEITKLFNPMVVIAIETNYFSERRNFLYMSD